MLPSLEITRGEEFTLSEGDNICGRDEDLTVSLSVDGISKQHFSVSVKGETAFLKDLDSSNGTYLNGKLVKSATVQNGDKVSLPDLILQVVYVAEKKDYCKKSRRGKRGRGC